MNFSCCFNYDSFLVIDEQKLTSDDEILIAFRFDYLDVR